MKLFLISALMILSFIGRAHAVAADGSFMLAMDYSTLMRFALNDGYRGYQDLNKASAYEEKKAPVIEKKGIEDDAKWEQVREFKNKPRSLSGSASFEANDGVSIGAAAGYVFPDEQNFDKEKADEIYSLKLNVEMAL